MPFAEGGNEMREIRFRAWNEVNKTMYTDAINNCKDTFDMVLKHPQIYEVMQYTGLKDKNGVEIYEGDIVSSKNKSGGCETSIDAVVFKNGRFVLNDQEGILTDMWIADDDLEYIEIIGNIYKNSELLEESK